MNIKVNDKIIVGNSITNVSTVYSLNNLQPCFVALKNYTAKFMLKLSAC